MLYHYYYNFSNHQHVKYGAALVINRHKLHVYIV